MTKMRVGKIRILAATGLISLSSIVSVSPASAAVTVDGAGSTWSQIAVDQWRADVARQGLTINYQGVGSTSGRVYYYQSQVDFAVSEIPFNNDGGVNEISEAARRPYAYLPIVAGGTAFMYNLKINGSQVRNLQLSPATLAKIFTGAVRNWNDASIKADNPSLSLPNLPIKVVIRSDGSGTSAQFTAYMKSQTPTEWNTFCGLAGLGSNCVATSLYPNPGSLNFAAQQYSDGVANFVGAPYNDGAITYVEYGYAKERGFPVASIKNKAGNYAQPTARSVALALTGATLNPDGTQVLTGVYNSNNADAYPVSSYSYMIVPTTTAAPFSEEKGEALSKFIAYFVCAGQQKAEQLGYSPLPKNLVQAAFTAMARIPGAAPAPSLSSCSNPTLTGDFMSGGEDDETTDTTTPGTTTPSTNPDGTPNTTPDGSGGGNGDTTPSTIIDSEGNVIEIDTSGSGSSGGQVSSAIASPIEVPPREHSTPVIIYMLVLLCLIAIVVLPPRLIERLAANQTANVK